MSGPLLGSEGSPIVAGEDDDPQDESERCEDDDPQDESERCEVCGKPEHMQVHDDDCFPAAFVGAPTEPAPQWTEPGDPGPTEPTPPFDMPSAIRSMIAAQGPPHLERVDDRSGGHVFGNPADGSAVHWVGPVVATPDGVFVGAALENHTRATQTPRPTRVTSIAGRVDREIQLLGALSAIVAAWTTPNAHNSDGLEEAIERARTLLVEGSK